jgi:hypothetical protein
MGRQEEGILPYDMPTPREPMISRYHVERGNKVHEGCFVSPGIRVDGRMRAPLILLMTIRTMFVVDNRAHDSCDTTNCEFTGHSIQVLVHSVCGPTGESATD